MGAKRFNAEDVVIASQHERVRTALDAVMSVLNDMLRRTGGERGREFTGLEQDLWDDVRQARDLLILSFERTEEQ